MKTKTITFSEFLSCKKELGGTSFNNIFEIAWKRSSTYTANQINRNRILKVAGVVGFGLVFLCISVMLSPSKFAFADTVDLRSLMMDSPELHEKLKTVKRSYTSYLRVSNKTENHSFFMEMICKVLNKEEVKLFIDTVKELEARDIINLIDL